MAYSFIKNKKGGVGVLLDSAADISLVPVDQFFPGTFAFTADGSARYRLSTSRSWVEVAGGGVTPGGGWPEDLPLPSEGGYGYTDEDETDHKIDSKYLPEGSGLPEVSGSGKALVSINGEWVEQDGYGWTEEGGELSIEWDGNTDGLEEVPVGEGMSFWRISDKTPASLIGAQLVMSDADSPKTITQDSIMASGSWGYVASEGTICVILSDNTVVEELSATFAHKGLYTITYSGTIVHLSRLTMTIPETVHKIDSKYLPGMIVNFSREIDHIAADKEFGDVCEAALNGELIIGLYDAGSYDTLVLNLSARCNRRTASRSELVFEAITSATFKDDGETFELIKNLLIWTEAGGIALVQLRFNPEVL